MPAGTIAAGGVAGLFAGPAIARGLYWLGGIVNAATALQPIPMGIAVSVIMGLVLTLPISSAALAISLGLSGLAAVLGFAAASLFACTTAWITVAFLAFLTPGLHPPPLAPMVGELAMTILFYVPTTLVAGWLHHKLVGASRGDI